MHAPDFAHRYCGESTAPCSQPLNSTNPTRPRGRVRRPLRPGTGRRVLGLLGPNGAGKSTTVSMLCGLLRPDRGDVVFDDGASPMNGRTDEFKRRIGLVPQDIALMKSCQHGRTWSCSARCTASPAPNLGRRVGEAGAGRAGRSRARQTIHLQRRHEAPPQCACALVHDPDVLVFDEPTVGVDPQSRNAIFDNLEVLRDRGKALMYTTHYMEAERLCDRIVIVDHGRVVANDELGALLRHARAGERLEIDVGQTVDCTPLLSCRACLRQQSPMGCSPSNCNHSPATWRRSSRGATRRVLRYVTSIRCVPILRMSSSR